VPLFDEVEDAELTSICSFHFPDFTQNLRHFSQVINNLNLGWSDIFDEVLLFSIQSFCDSWLSQSFLWVESILETQITLRNFINIDVNCSLCNRLLVNSNKQELAEWS
jgi:hypothetical protein